MLQRSYDLKVNSTLDMNYQADRERNTFASGRIQEQNAFHTQQTQARQSLAASKHSRRSAKLS